MGGACILADQELAFIECGFSSMARAKSHCSGQKREGHGEVALRTFMDWAWHDIAGFSSELSEFLRALGSQSSVSVWQHTLVS